MDKNDKKVIRGIGKLNISTHKAMKKIRGLTLIESKKDKKPKPFILTDKERSDLLLVSEQLQCVIKWNEAHKAGKDEDKIVPHLRMKEIQKELNKTK